MTGDQPVGEHPPIGRFEAVKDAVSQIDHSLADGAQKVAAALIEAIEKAKRGDE